MCSWQRFSNTIGCHWLLWWFPWRRRAFKFYMIPNPWQDMSYAIGVLLRKFLLMLIILKCFTSVFHSFKVSDFVFISFIHLVLTLCKINSFSSSLCGDPVSLDSFVEEPISPTPKSEQQGPVFILLHIWLTHYHLLRMLSFPNLWF